MKVLEPAECFNKPSLTMIGTIDKTLSLRTEMKVLFKNANILRWTDGSALKVEQAGVVVEGLEEKNEYESREHLSEQVNVVLNENRAQALPW